MTLPLDHRLTDEEFIRFGHTSDDAVARECAERLLDGGADAEIASLEERIKELEAELQDKEDAVEERIQDAVESETAKLEDRIADLDDQLTHERSRVEEFAEENAAARAEIERLKHVTKEQEDHPMATDDQIVELLAIQTRTHALLADILETFRADKPANTASKAKPQAQTKKKAAGKKAPTLEDVKDAFLAFNTAHGKDAAIAVVKDAAGDVRNIGAVPEDKYAAVIAAFEAESQKEAA